MNESFVETLRAIATGTCSACMIPQPPHAVHVASYVSHHNSGLAAGLLRMSHTTGKLLAASFNKSVTWTLVNTPQMRRDLLQNLHRHWYMGHIQGCPFKVAG